MTDFLTRSRHFFILCRGVLSTALLLLATFFFSILIILSVSLCRIIPIRSWRRSCLIKAHQLPTMWMAVNRWIMLISTHGKWQINTSPGPTLNRRHTYLLISNHQSWVDILSIGYVFNARISTARFFMKKELLWTLPITGIACYLLGYPMLERATSEDIKKNPKLRGKDQAILEKACIRFKRYPVTMINFVEGTRFTPEKHAKSRSPYQCLLKPRSTGLGIVMNAMGNTLDGLLDVTIDYDPRPLSLWDFLCGRLNSIRVHYQLYPIPPEFIAEDRTSHRALQRWLKARWEEKDKRLQQWRGLNLNTPPSLQQPNDASRHTPDKYESSSNHPSDSSDQPSNNRNDPPSDAA